MFHSLYDDVLRTAFFDSCVCTRHPLNRDLDGSGVNYLAHSSLSSLHIHLTTNLVIIIYNSYLSK